MTWLSRLLRFLRLKPARPASTDEQMEELRRELERLLAKERGDG